MIISLEFVVVGRKWWAVDRSQNQATCALAFNIVIYPIDSKYRCITARRQVNKQMDYRVNYISAGGHLIFGFYVRAYLSMPPHTEDMTSVSHLCHIHTSQATLCHCKQYQCHSPWPQWYSYRHNSQDCFHTRLRSNSTCTRCTRCICVHHRCEQHYEIWGTPMQYAIYNGYWTFVLQQFISVPCCFRSDRFE